MWAKHSVVCWAALKAVGTAGNRAEQRADSTADPMAVGTAGKRAELRADSTAVLMAGLKAVRTAARLGG